MNILVTGATGFIGRHLVQKLSQSDDRIIGLARHNRICQELSAPNILSSQVDILDKKNLIDFIRSTSHVQLVYHLAGKVFTKEKRGNPYLEVNTEGTRLLAQAIMEAYKEYPRFIFLSSIAAVVGKNSDVVDEATPPDPVTRYGKSKLKAENILLQYKKKYGLPVTIVRAPLVYGPDEKSYSRTTLLFKAVKRGIRPFGSGTNLLSLCYVENLIFFLEKLRYAENISDDVYFVADGEPRPLNEWIRIIASAQGVKSPRYKIPDFLTSFLLRFGPHGLRKLINEMCSNWACNICKAKNKLEYSPPYTSEEGMRRTISWYRRKGII